MPNSSSGLIIFVKAPQPGKVKTRLGRSIGMDKSCEVYRQFGRDWIARLNQLGLPLLIFYAPQEERPSIQSWLGDSHHYYPQQGGDLGDRMTHAFSQGFELGFEHLMIFGSDSPDIPLDVIQQGIQKIQGDNIVVGPSNDGGYYSIGFSQKQWFPEIFENIEWSSESVYQSTIDILSQHHKSVMPLQVWFDVDTLDDLKELYLRIQDTQTLPHTLSYLQQHLMDELEP